MVSADGPRDWFLRMRLGYERLVYPNSCRRKGSGGGNLKQELSHVLGCGKLESTHGQGMGKQRSRRASAGTRDQRRPQKKKQASAGPRGSGGPARDIIV